MNRTGRHFLLGALSVAAALGAGATGAGPDALDRISLATSWLCLVCFAGALLIGPLHTLRTGRLLTNHLVRRDLGIWCAVNGLVHLGLAFKVSMNPAYMAIYIDGASAWPPPPVRRQLYFLAVVGSLGIAVLFALLLSLSSNRAIRWLGPVWWKRLQRTSYAAFALTIAHSVVFQLIEARTLWLVTALALLTIAVLAGQLAGRWRVRAAARVLRD
jgi:DMSO/TMAO reductase YedYZ heme-binding membrane subunit